MGVSLTLSNKFEVPEEEDQSIKALYVRTKRFVVDVIRYQQGKTLREILEVPATAEMEEEHKLRSLEVAAKDAELAAAAKSTAAADKDSEVAMRAEMKRKSIKRRASTAKLGDKVEVPTLEAI